MAFFAALPFLAETTGEIIGANLVRQAGLNTGRSAIAYLTEWFGSAAISNVARTTGTQFVGAVEGALTSEAGLASIGIGSLTVPEVIMLAGENTIANTVRTEATETLIGSAVADVAIETGMGEGVSSTVVLDEVLGTSGTGSVVIPEEASFLQRLEYSLNDIGITREGVGSYTWEQIVSGIGSGIYTVDEIANFYNNGMPQQFQDIIDSITNSRDGIGKMTEMVIIDANGNIVKDPLINNFHYIDPFLLGYSTGKIIAKTGYYKGQYIGKGTREVQLLVSMMKASTENPSDAFISKKLTAYLLSSEYLKDPEKNIKLYEQIYQIYDGNFKSKPFVNEKGEFSIVDETGKVVSYTGSKGIHEVFGMKIRNPSFDGWTGPSSPNDHLPTIDGTDKTDIDLLQAFSMCHDEGYEENGMFDTFSDLQYISRVSHFLNKRDAWASESSYYMANFAAFWFSNIGPLLNSITDRSLTYSGINKFVQADEGDFYTYMMSGFSEPNDNITKYGYAAMRGQRLIRNEGRNYFYAGLSEGLNEAYKELSEKFMDSAYIEAFDNLQIKI